jgi:hypothetical protein
MADNFETVFEEEDFGSGGDRGEQSCHDAFLIGWGSKYKRQIHTWPGVSDKGTEVRT